MMAWAPLSTLLFWSARAYVCPELADNDYFAITSAPSKFLEARTENTLRDPRSDRRAFPLALYQEDGAAFPRRAPFAAFAACVVDLFAVAPWAREFGDSLRDPSSARRRNLTKFLPNGLGPASSAEYLCRKVAAMGHAVSASRDGVVVLWVDVDCVFVAPPDAAFLSFTRGLDVATIGRLPVLSKRPETGVMSLLAGPATRRLTGRARALYEYGMADIAASCRDRRCRRHLSLNDVAVFKRLLVGDDAVWRDPTLRVGWFAVGCPEEGAAWAKAAVTYQRVGAHGDNFCPGAAEGASPFNLFQYVAHMKGRHGVMGGGERFRRHGRTRRRGEM